MVDEHLDIFLPYQIEWIDSQYTHRVYEKSRRIGITFAEAYWSFRKRLTEKVDHIFCSADFETSKEFLGYIKVFAEAANIQLGYDVIDEDGFQTERVLFPRGGKIMAVSSKPKALRGKGGDVTWDESAFHEDAEEWYRAAGPLTDWGGEFHIISTHNGPGTVFNDIVVKARNGLGVFKHYRTTLVDAVADGLAEKMPGDHRRLPTFEERGKALIESRKQRCLNLPMFNQEYMCEVIGQGSLITEADYDASTQKHPIGRDTATVGATPGPLFMGYDVGRSETGDQAVMWLLEQGEDPTAKAPEMRRCYRTVQIIELRGMPFDAQYEILSRVVSSPKIRRGCIERNGLGMQLAEQLERRFPGRVFGFDTTPSSKPVLCERVAGWVGTHRVGLPPENERKQDLLSVKRQLTQSGRMTYTHSDRFIALGLALEAAEGEAPQVFGHAATR